MGLFFSNNWKKLEGALIRAGALIRDNMVHVLHFPLADKRILLTGFSQHTIE